MSWPALIALVVGSYSCKWFGVFVLSRLGGLDATHSPGPLRWFPATVALIPAALFAALILVRTFDAGGSLQIDARAAGLVAGVIAVWRNAPFIMVVLVAMAVTALIRWQTLW
ncbi:MAG: branched-subunit amino acid transport protein [Candidatus Aldehydirespiratoraceae bacterium]|jgi:branched-subunit amino acid transport protein